MTFTDDDLKRLKEWIDDQNMGWKFNPLLARLEAAEDAVRESERMTCKVEPGHVEGRVFHVQWEEALKAWRKARGL